MEPDEAEREAVLEKLRRVRAKFDAMSPEDQALFNDSPEIQFITDVIQRFMDGSIPEDEARRWFDATEREIEEKARYPRSKEN